MDLFFVAHCLVNRLVASSEAQNAHPPRTLCVVSSPFQLLCVCEAILAGHVERNAQIFVVAYSGRRPQWHAIAHALDLDVRAVARPSFGPWSGRAGNVLRRSEAAVAAVRLLSAAGVRPDVVVMGHYSDRVQRLIVNLWAHRLKRVIVVDDGMDSLMLPARRSVDLRRRCGILDRAPCGPLEFFSAFPLAVDAPDFVVSHSFKSIQSRLRNGRLAGSSVFVGQPLVSLGLLTAASFRNGLDFARTQGVRIYFAHPRDTDCEVDLAAGVGLDVRRDDSPLELVVGGARTLMGFNSTGLMSAKLMALADEVVAVQPSPSNVAHGHRGRFLGVYAHLAGLGVRIVSESCAPA